MADDEPPPPPSPGPPDEDDEVSSSLPRFQQQQSREQAAKFGLKGAERRVSTFEVDLSGGSGGGGGLMVPTINAPPPPSPPVPPPSEDNTPLKKRTQSVGAKQTVPAVPTTTTAGRSPPRSLDAILHPEIPETSPFTVKPNSPERPKCNPGQLAAKVDLAFMSVDSIRRAMTWQPKSGDVILVSPPCCGVTPTLSRIVRRMAATDPSAPLSYRGSCPWIESKYVDEDPSILDAPQPGSTRRVFRSCMSSTMARPHDASTAIYLVFLRQPIDLRAAWFSHVRRLWDVQMSAEVTEFDEMFTIDDFAHVDVTLCGSGEGPDGIYEKWLVEWYRTAKKSASTIKLIFYESLLASPEKEMKELWNVLNPEKRGEVPAQIMEACMKDLGVEIEKKPVEAPGTTTDSPMVARKSFARRISLSMTRSTATLAGVRAKNLADGFIGLGVASYKKKSSVAFFEDKWYELVDSTNAHKSLKSYESFFEEMTGDKYPYPQQKAAVDLKKAKSMVFAAQDRIAAAAAGGGSNNGEEGGILGKLSSRLSFRAKGR